MPTLPPLTGEVTAHHDGRGRVWTVEHLPADRLPHFEPSMRSPAFVALNGWFVAFDGGTLYAHRNGVKHDLHGSKHHSAREADEAAYAAGPLGLHVYEDVAGRYGLPTD